MLLVILQILICYAFIPEYILHFLHAGVPMANRPHFPFNTFCHSGRLQPHKVHPQHILWITEPAYPFICWIIDDGVVSAQRISSMWEIRKCFRQLVCKVRGHYISLGELELPRLDTSLPRKYYSA